MVYFLIRQEVHGWSRDLTNTHLSDQTPCVLEMLSLWSQHWLLQMVIITREWCDHNWLMLSMCLPW